MSTWLIPRNELTAEQLRAIELDSSKNRMILGGPGSGKTQVLLHRAKHLRDNLRCSDSDYHVFVYTSVLSTFIKHSLKVLNIPEDNVSTVDKWCMDYYRKKIGGKLPWKDKSFDFDAIRAAVAKHAQQASEKPYRFVLVDEAQDLTPELLSLLRHTTDHLTVCADHKQQLYDDGSSVEQILSQIGIQKSSISLIDTFRCCPYIVYVAAELIEDPAERQAYLNQVKSEQVEKEKPVYYLAKDAEDEKLKLAEAIRSRITRGERTAVLFPQKRQAFGYAKGLQELGLEVEDPKNIDFNSIKPKLLPYHSAKGLTFDSVFLPRLLDDAFYRTTLDRKRRQLFVGITRAVKWVYLTNNREGGFEPLNELLNSDAARYLTVRRHSAPTTSAPPEFNATSNHDEFGVDGLF
jgi:superfamily I DNA/RNA helicase